MAEARGLRLIVIVGLVALLAVVAGLSLDRAWRGRYDFHHFYLDARYVWTEGALNENHVAEEPDNRQQLPFYLPTVALALAPLTAFGREPAALLWTTGQVAALLYSLLVLRRWAARRMPPESAWAISGVVLLVSVPALLEAARFNQVSGFVLALVLGGLRRLERSQPVAAGTLLGAAAVLKLLPILFLPWLLLKRRWMAAGAMCFASVVLAVVPPVMAFGPARAWRYHVAWWHYNVHGDAAGGLLDPTLPEHFIDRRNQSITQVIARWTWAEHPDRLCWQPFNLDAETIRRAGQGATATLLLLTAVLAWRPWGRLRDEQWRAEAAAVLVAMLAFAPLVRQYYLEWALPALIVLGRAAATERGRRIGWTGLLVWLAGMIAWIWPITRSAGAHLLMLLVLSGLLWRRAYARDSGDAPGEAAAAAPG